MKCYPCMKYVAIGLISENILPILYKVQLTTLDEDWAAHYSVVGDNYSLCTVETSPLCGWKMWCPKFDWFDSKYIGVFINIAYNLLVIFTEINSNSDFIL